MKSVKHSIATVIVILSAAVICLAQAPDTLWTHHGVPNSRPYKVLDIAAGNEYVFAGDSASTAIQVLKTDAFGNTLWRTTFHRFLSNTATAIRVIGDGSIGVIGSAYSGSWLFLLAKLNSGGDTAWVRTYPTQGGYTYDGLATSDGGFLLVGPTQYGGLGWDFLAVKTNGTGDTLWTHTYGGTGFERAYGVTEAVDGGYLLIGETESFGAGGKDVYLVKIGNNGAMDWSRTFGTSGSEIGYHITKSYDGGYVLLCGKGAENYSLSEYLIKIDATGNLQSDRLYGVPTPSTSVDALPRINQTADSGYITTSPLFGVLRIAADWDSLWCKGYVSMVNGGEARIGDLEVRQTVDGGLVVCGNNGTYLKTVAEPPDRVTIQRRESSSGVILHWIAPQMCNYEIYSSTSVTPPHGPPGEGWLLEATLLNLPAGASSRTDSVTDSPYKVFSIISNCP